MDKVVEDNFGQDFPDVGEEAAIEDQEFGQDFTDLETEEKELEAGKPTWAQTIGDVFVQSGRGVLKAFTWPADVLKAGMIGSALSGIDELEDEFERAGRPFNREELTKSVYNTAEFFPTQELAEKGIEKATGFSFEPKTELGRKAGQTAQIATLNPGSLAKKALAGATAAGTTYGLEQAGVPGAEIIGDVVGSSTSALRKVPKVISDKAKDSLKTAQKHALPFLEYMNQENAPWIRGKLFKKTEERLKQEFNVSNKQALDKILTNEIPIKALKDKGINLDVMAEEAYTKAISQASKDPKLIKTDQIVKNIDQEIAYIKSKAPNPSDAQKTAIQILENERDILQVATMNSEQLINQYQNYNSNVKGIYRKPQFSGVEEEVRQTYKFLNEQLVQSLEHQGQKETATYFKEANKIYHAKSQLNQSESILSKAFDGGNYSPQKLQSILNSKNKRKFLERNLGKGAVQEIQDIAEYGVKATENIGNFIKLDSPFVLNEITTWGNLAPLVFMPGNLAGPLMTVARPIAERVQGKLLTRPALRETYKMTLKHAAEGQYNLLKKDFFKLEEGIAKEWGDTQTFIDEAMQELEFDGFD